ncbi:TetR family transcriptional regulator [Nakamurella endophytica]|uniref:TetR family transcriptional regulator n=1 Tax=Nakamurella endophytica TaxID=1748367 RepID=A0A917SNE0_9ACTN|nr:TetR/AcrR family transcriptional regulator [Nakamurella endophytica]GGL89563.1 TetR family transcriptional regulator [Nakamurella endophytica]
MLDASVALFNERGFDRTSVADVAARLNVGKSALYHHVPGKDALLGLALDRALSGLEAVADAVRTADADPAERLRLLVSGSVHVLVERLPYVTLLLRVRGNTDVERAALERRRRLDRLAADLVREAVAAGRLRPDLEPRTTARLLFGTVNSLAEWLRPGDSGDVAALADRVVGMVFDGLRPR